jgi:hypothetical protein
MMVENECSGSRTANGDHSFRLDKHITLLHADYPQSIFIKCGDIPCFRSRLLDANSHKYYMSTRVSNMTICSRIY